MNENSLHHQPKASDYKYHVAIAFLIVIAAVVVFNGYLARDQDRVDA